MRTFVHDNDVYMDGYDTGYDTGYNSGTNEGTERTTVSLFLKGKLTKGDVLEELNITEAEFDEVVAKYQNELVKN
ncbi:MAG: hypothetical protein MJZ11_08790 [Lachnospiraceae bacterium]|nr:hypothetical protein [Lachnospiraceae bacterium]